MDAPLMDSVAVACALTWPGVGDENVIVHWPLASVFAPAPVHVPLAAEWTAPLESVSVKATCSPAAGTNVPAPLSFESVTVKVCGLPTSLVADGPIVMLAAAQAFDASALSPAFPSPLSRCRVMPPTVTLVLALIVVVPVVVDLITTVHEPVPPLVVQLFGPTNAPGPETIAKMIVVPFGTGANPEPSLTFT
jgi:hypothetical protein